MKISFRDDYSELAHPRILRALAELGNRQCEGYGLDEYSMEASRLIGERVDRPGVSVHFVSGGTQANLTVIGSLLRPFEAVIAAESGHIAVHEAGAIEATGHRICLAEGKNGKISVDGIEKVVRLHYGDDHRVNPKMVFISNSTEVGTLYHKSELEEISSYCKEEDLYLYMDGARLGAALASTQNDLSYADVARLCDIFYLGGTKNGAMFGEAIVIANDKMKCGFTVAMKQRGARLAKGAALGLQFLELFRDGLYEENAKHADDMAMRLADGLAAAGYNFLFPPETNQIFPIFPNATVKKLHEIFEFY
ncbi:MAG: aminotransferase class V-fold PLP-dependent enzyme, partial [Rickettsiales bacterium]|nr:aminotransferase class V-fold PLP-dependent enzyme [Rickettsiales bacterium]